MDEIQLNDEESVLFLKIVRNDTRNSIRRVAIKETVIEISFNDETQQPEVLPREEAMGWKDKEWQEFFQKHEPLL